MRYLCGILLFIGTGVSGGCRALQSHRQTRSLSTARQMSLRGASMLQQEDYEQAESLFSEALRHSPADERAQWGMAEVQWRAGERDEAIAHMEKAVLLSGQNPEMLVRLGEMYRQNQQLDAALDAAEQAISRDRSHHAAWSLKGQVLMDQKKYIDALDCYQRALIHRPDDAAVRIAVAELYRSLERPQRALATLERLSDNQPTVDLPASAWVVKGQALADLGQPYEARDCLRQAALCADDSDAELLLRLAELQFEFGELAEARVCLGRARQTDPTNPRLAALQQKLDRRFASISEQNGARLLPAGFSRPAPSTEPPYTSKGPLASPPPARQLPAASRSADQRQPTAPPRSY